MKSKKAISAVVATVLIILITVAAVAIIWAAIIPMIKNQISGGTVCLDAVAALSVKGDYTCIDTTTSTIKVQVARSAPGSSDFKLDDIRIILHKSDGSTYSTLVTNSTGIHGTIPNANEGELYALTGNLYNANAQGVSIAPIVRQGNQQRECDAGSVVTLSNCQ